VGLAAASVLAGAAPPAGATAPLAYYVAVGASESVGVQPTGTAPGGERTDQGYADDLTSIERARWPGLQLVDLGCPGITVAAALTGSDRCGYAEGSEVDQALAFLGDHRSSTVLVTVDLGFNDLRPCLAHTVVDHACVERAFDTIGADLPEILSALESAGDGARLHIVGLEHADPFLADARLGPAGTAFAGSTVPVFAALNGLLGRIYAGSGALIAAVPSRFDAASLTAAAPLNQADLSPLCSLTWMCAPAPMGPNLHPTAAGYRLIAGSIASALSAALGTAGTAPASAGLGAGTG
jgi:lysophospholipase L1-like esterase